MQKQNVVIPAWNHLHCQPSHDILIISKKRGDLMPFQVVRDDLTRMKVDVIVNTANPYPVIGSGTDAAVYAAAGENKLLKEREKIGMIARGDVAITGGYSLPSRYIIHAVGPIWRGGYSGEEAILRSCYEKSLALAVKRKCKSIAFPLISTGNYGFPKDLALKIVSETIGSFLDNLDEDYELMVYLVVFGSKATRLSESMFDHIEKRIDDRFAREKEKIEYAADYSVYYEAHHEEEEEDFVGAPSNKEELYREESARRRRRIEEDYPMPNASESDSCMPSAVPPVSKKKSETIGGFASKVLKETKPTKKKRSLEEILAQQDETFTDMLLRLIKEKGLTNAQAYKRSNVDKKLFSKIKNDRFYKPHKKTAMAFSIGLELNLDEAKDLLARAGFAFSPSNNLDKVIQYCIEEEEYNIINVEIILYELGLETLCNS